MGYDVARFTDEIDEDFCCIICTLVLEDPVQSPCKHMFCNECIITWLALQNKRTCPFVQCLFLYRVEDLKSVPKYFRNILDKMEILCEFKSRGCESIFPLERLQDHRIMCKFKPSPAEILCDKGCNMLISRLEYDGHCCIKHLTHKVKSHQEHIKRLTEEVGRQQEKIIQLNHEMNQLLRQLILSQTSISSKQKDDMTLYYRPPRRRWQVLENIQIPIEAPNVLECDKSYHAFAQSLIALSHWNQYFRIIILDGIQDNLITVGVTLKGHPYSLAPGNYEGSIGYNSKGKLWKNKTTKIVGPNWQKGDIIQCGIKYLNKYTDYSTVEIHFSVNGQLITKSEIEMFVEDTFFPTVYMYRNLYTSVCPKVEYLQN